jgi:hypothetical protein
VGLYSPQKKRGSFAFKFLGVFLKENFRGFFGDGTEAHKNFLKKTQYTIFFGRENMFRYRFFLLKVPLKRFFKNLPSETASETIFYMLKRPEILFCSVPKRFFKFEADFSWFRF